jgi:hypothetical protein
MNKIEPPAPPSTHRTQPSTPKQNAIGFMVAAFDKIVDAYNVIEHYQTAAKAKEDLAEAERLLDRAISIVDRKLRTR